MKHEWHYDPNDATCQDSGAVSNEWHKLTHKVIVTMKKDLFKSKIYKPFSKRNNN